MKINKELLKGSLEILVLSSVSKTPLYGYEIAKQIRAKSNKLFSLGEGTLYPILHKLEKAKFLESYWQEMGGRKRKYYQVTRKGKKILEAKTAEWKIFSRGIEDVAGI